jgi:hypothetical protein
MSKNTVGKKKTPSKAEVILVGLDIHADRQVAVRQIDGQTPQPAQCFPTEGLLKWVKKQLTLAKVVHTCYPSKLSKTLSTSSSTKMSNATTAAQ